MQAGRSIRGALDRLADDSGRSGRHLLIGLGVTAAAVGASALIARASAPIEDEPELHTDYEMSGPSRAKRSRAVFSLLWPPLFVALTLSGLRIWNAPKSRERSQALAIWGVAQGLNALWMTLGPGRLGGPLATATAAVGTAATYLWRARRVDAPAVQVVAPYVGWAGIANVLTEELGRKKEAKPTLH